jgi:MYXO-CTERM domain-containing protein
LISEVELSAAQLADPQLELKFTKGAGTDVVCASYADGTGNTLASFSGALNSLGCTDSATDVFTASLQTVQTGIEAFDPVAIPEPPSFTLMMSGLIALGGLAWRRRRA